MDKGKSKVMRGVRVDDGGGLNVKPIGELLRKDKALSIWGCCGSECKSECGGV